MALETGIPAPDFQMMDQHGQAVALGDLAGSKALIVFIPFPFTRVCQGEMCELRDQVGRPAELDAKVVAITCDSVPSNRRWAKDQGFEFPVLSDFWPHGKVTKAYDTFNEALGVADRTTYVLDEEGTIQAVVASDGFGLPRPFEDYVEALESV